LKPGGQFVFLEHGLSDDPTVQRWQRRLTPVFTTLGGGCHLDRNIQEFIERQGFAIGELNRFYLPRTPRFAGAMYQGVARKP
jgi:hypothetical protein